MTQPEHESEFTIAKGNDVSVVIPVHNEADALPDLIDAILHSLESVNVNPTVIVVDDGSTDNTEAVVNDFSRSVTGDLYVRQFHQDNRGAPAARNLGLVESRGEFIQFLDSDDLLEPEKLSAQVRVMREYRRLQMVFSQWQCAEHGRPVEDTAWRKNFSADRANLLDLLLGKSRRQTLPLWTANTLYRRSLCMRLGPWDTRLVRLQDRLYNLRALLLAIPYRYIPAMHARARRHGGDRISDHFAEVESLENMRAAWRTMQDLLTGSGALNGRRRRLLGRTYYSLARPAFIAGAGQLGAELLGEGLAIAPVSAIWLKLQLVRLLYRVLGTAGANRLFGWKMRLATSLRAAFSGAHHHR
ncbi:MAG: glycosyltransferase family A protein [Candidatus Brocadiia bacterium]|nr:glycosyltransferase family A protein [Candidatus Brocadiia bacterium]